MTGCQRRWRSWRWRCWVNDREKYSTPGNAGSSAADGVVRRCRHTWKSAVDVVEGSVRILRSVYGWRARQRAVIGGDDDSVLVAVVGMA